MDNFLHRQNVFLLISKATKKKSLAFFFFSSFTFIHLFFAIKTIERCSLAASYFFFSVCLVICLVVSIIASFVLCLITNETKNKQTKFFSLFFLLLLLILNYRIICFHLNIQQLSISMLLLFFFLSFSLSVVRQSHYFSFASVVLFMFITLVYEG